ncbi:response regulator [Polyangium sp. y55x31]|uniref:response regulator n=1 Tax=Polyangium sp. y55x31 TaxID=3042688 RepID=UPI0024825733|nr:response regulator [Polyangium sp. y55x31]MDI1483782.1 response regulator [Polyangium sp. y55x31]
MARILVVDDDTVFGWLTQRRLQNAGHIVDVRGGPMGVFADLSKGDYDLVLLDLRMPALSGADIVRMVRSRKGITTKIVLYSSVDEEELAERARTLGVEGYATKGEMSRLLDVVRSVLGSNAASA